MNSGLRLTLLIAVALHAGAAASEPSVFPLGDEIGRSSGLRFKASPEAFQRLRQSGNDWVSGAPPVQDLLLIAAVNRGDLAATKAALAKWANPNAHDDTGDAPIITATIRNELPIVRELTVRGADANASSHGLTALCVASAYGYTDIARQLLKSGALPDLRDGAGRTPLLHAVSARHNEILQLLLESGADPNRSTREKETPLFIAADQDNLAAVQLLLRYGADPSLANREGISPLFQALFLRHWAVVGRLLAAGAAPNPIEQRMIDERRAQSTVRDQLR